MAHVMVTHDVADFAKWQVAFNDVAAMRSEAGEKSAEIYRHSENQNSLTAVFEWDSAENATEYFTSARLKTAMQSAGVTSAPQVTFLDAV